MPIIAPIIAWLTELSFGEAIIAGTLGFLGIKVVGSEIKSTFKEAIIPAALIFGAIYYLSSKSQK